MSTYLVALLVTDMPFKEGKKAHAVYKGELPAGAGAAGFSIANDLASPPSGINSPSQLDASRDGFGIFKRGEATSH